MLLINLSRVNLKSSDSFKICNGSRYTTTFTKGAISKFSKNFEKLHTLINVNMYGNTNSLIS